MPSINFPQILGLWKFTKKVSLIAFLATCWGTISTFATTDVCLGINWINKLFRNMFLGRTMFHTWFSTTTRRQKKGHIPVLPHTSYSYSLSMAKHVPLFLKPSKPWKLPPFHASRKSTQLRLVLSIHPQPKALTVVAAVARFTSSSFSRGEAEWAPSCPIWAQLQTKERWSDHPRTISTDTWWITIGDC